MNGEARDPLDPVLPPGNPAGEEGETAPSRPPASGVDPDATVVTTPPLGSEADRTVVVEPDPQRTLASAAGSPAAPADAEGGLPERIGPYPILEELGRGGMGVVYVARDPRLDRRIALKVLPLRFASEPTVFERFQGEAKLLAAMNHPNISTIHSLEEADGRHFLTMELIDGQDLSTRIKTSRPAPEEWLPICRQIAVALEGAHRNGIVHLDLKPQNVMVTGDGLVKVLDFGLAMALGSAGDDVQARTKARTQDAVSGTPGYMSPEQLKGQAVDSRADVWAFGCILYECITGKPSFPGPTMTERIQATLEADPDLEAIPEETPERIRELLSRCLTKDLDGRLDTITKARQEIEQAIALRSLPKVLVRPETVPNNFPAQLSSFVGRKKALEDVRNLLSANRLVTLVGVGGGGKTRLALEAARGVLHVSPDGAWFIELGPLADPALVPQEVATALGLKDEAGRSPADAVAGHLKDKASLLIIDNCEHVLGAVAGFVTPLLMACPGLRILATSREGLGVAGEVIYQVPSLALPASRKTPTLQELEGSEAVQLFLARAGEVKTGFELGEGNAAAVLAICRRLDGIPLALELAAARIRALPAEEIAKRLDNRFRLLGSARKTGLPHQQTLRALIDWSYDHLDASEQTLLRRLSLFAGGWTLDAAEAVCAGEGIDEWELLDLLTFLVDKSLVVMDAQSGHETGTARYRMLETIREYARERLNEKDEGAEILGRHRGFFLTLAEDCEPKLTGPQQAKSLARLSAEHDNLRLALDMSMVIGVDPEIGWRFGGALGRYWYIGGHWNEGRNAYRELLDRPEAPRTSAAAADALNWAGNLAKLQGDATEARLYLEESLSIRRALGDEEGIAASLNNLGNVMKDQADFARARELYEESLDLQTKLGDTAGMSRSLNNLGFVLYLQGDFPQARARHEQSLELRRGLGDRWGVAGSLTNLSLVAEATGDYEEAAAYLSESLVIHREMENRWGIAAALNQLGRLDGFRGHAEGARAAYEEALATFRELGDRRSIGAALNNLGVACAAQGEFDRALDSFRESLSIFKDLEDPGSASAVLGEMGRLAVTMEDFGRGARLLGAAETFRERVGRGSTGVEQDRMSPVLFRLKTELGEDALEQAWSAGKALTLEEAFALAKGDAR